MTDTESSPDTTGDQTAETADNGPPEWVKGIIERREQQLADPNIPKMNCGECGRPVILRGPNVEKITAVVCQDCTMGMF